MLPLSPSNPQRLLESAEYPTAVEVSQLNVYDEHGFTPLNKAIQASDTTLIAQLLQAGADKDALNAQGESNLYHAVVHKNRKVICFLLVQGFDCNLKNTNGNTPLHEAVRQKRTDVIRILMQASANPTSANDNGEIPIDWAASNPTIQAILTPSGSYDATPSITATSDMDTLFKLIQNANKSAEDLEALITPNMPLEAIDEYGYSLMHYAILEGRVDFVELLIQHNSNLANEHLLEGGRTPLYFSAYSNQPAIVRSLLKSGADPKKANGNGETPIDAAKHTEELNRTILDMITAPWRYENSQALTSQPRSDENRPLVTISEASDEEDHAPLSLSLSSRP
jgi:ankyrin repeat protein